MAKFKKGDQFKITINEVIESNNGTLYRADFSTLVFDDYGLENLEKITPKYEEGDEVKVITNFDNLEHTALIIDYRESTSIILLKENGKYLVSNGCTYIKNENIIEKTGKKINLELK